MRATIFGSGYVGLTQGAVLAEVGHSIVCVDTDRSKIERLNKGVVPIYEPGLSTLIEKNHRKGNLYFTSDAQEGVRHGEVIFIAVGTPPGEDGSADLRHVKAAAKTIARHMESCKVIVNKSTVPVGTAVLVQTAVLAELDALGKKICFGVVSNPEFLKQGAAVADCVSPDRIIIGTDSPYAAKQMRALYAPFLEKGTPFLEMDVQSAELTKYAANAMLAAKISFMNEIANLAELLGADVDMVRRGLSHDPRIGSHFINPGCGYGGSCFPKDVKALIRAAEENGYRPKILRAIEDVNNKQKEKIFSLISAHYQGKLQGLTLALWGLAFKPDTDDMREAPSRVLMEALWKSGAIVRAYDPEAAKTAKNIYGEHRQFKLAATKEEALRGADALVICTEWKEFKRAALEVIKAELKAPVIFDGRNIHSEKAAKALGFTYYGIGRGMSVKRQRTSKTAINGEKVPATC